MIKNNLPPLPFSTRPLSTTFHLSNSPNRLSISANRSSNSHSCDAIPPIDVVIGRFVQLIDHNFNQFFLKLINLNFF